MTAIRRFALRLLSCFWRGPAETELAREIDAHLQLLEDTFLARGMSPRDAKRAARRAFGGVEQAKERQRDQRSFRWLQQWGLDARLGLRMLVKYPGLAVVGGLGMAVAIAIAVGGFTVVQAVLHATLPLEEGDRIVSLQCWDLAAGRADRKVLSDVGSWRDELTSVVDVTAFRGVGRNLIAPGTSPEVVPVAEMHASGFRVARVRPLLGRPLLDGDERPGAPAVVVIGYDVWKGRLSGDPGIIGRQVQLGNVRHTVVGVMPEGFAFPLNQSAWVPLATDALVKGRRQGPTVNVFGRLAPGATIESARAEFETVGRRAAAAFPDTHAQLRAQLLPYTVPFVDMDEPENALAIQVVNLVVVLLLIVVCVNVAILVYARTAGRQAEIALRTALGATRGRIVIQLFIEALVLSAVAAAVGLGLVTLGFRQLNAALLRVSAQFPFWIHFGVSREAVIYVLGIMVLAAAIVGAVPALKVTGRRVHSSLKSGGAAGATMHMGATWTTLIVAQVGFAVALLPPAVFYAWETTRQGMAAPGSGAADFLTARLILEPAPPVGVAAGTTDPARYRDRDRLLELTRRLQGEPGVVAVSSSLSIPGQESTVWIDIEGVPMPPDEDAEYSGFGVREGKFGHEVRFNRIDTGFFEAFGVSVLAGRPFSAGDLRPDSSAVVVNRAFADRLGGATAVLGRRLRYTGRSGDTRAADVDFGRWYEVVGVVGNYPPGQPPATTGLVDAVLYHPAALGDVYPVTLATRLRAGAASAFAARLREVSALVDPELQLRNVATMDEALRKEQGIVRLAAGGLLLLTLSVVLLSAAGIYALMSFTVTQRRKEIAIRAALGADERKILRAIFSGVVRQLAIGGLIGAAVTASLDRLTHGDLMSGRVGTVLPVVVVFITLVGLLAALGPARRGLRIQPTDALREE